MSKKILKVGVVGLIRGLGVISTVARDENLRITAICDLDQKRIDAAVEKLGDLGVEDLQCFTDFDEMLRDADMDAVFIANFANQHVPFVVRAMDAGKHVISEIPAIYSVKEATILKNAVARHPELKYMVGENCCYWAFIEAWKRMYEEGKFGDVAYAESEYLHAIDWRKMKPEDFPPEHWRFTNPAIRYLTHNLGPLLYIMDDECVSVSCMSADVTYNPYRPHKKNDVAIFKTAKGAVIRILICFDAYVGCDHNFALIGTRGTIETDKTKPLDVAHSFARFSDVEGSMDEKIEIPVALSLQGESNEGHGGADAKMMRAFVDCVLHDKPSPLNVDYAIRISLPGIIAHESSLQGGELMKIPKL